MERTPPIAFETPERIISVEQHRNLATTLVRLISRGDSEAMDISDELAFLHFEGIEIPDDIEIGRLRKMQIACGNTVCDVSVRMYNEVIGLTAEESKGAARTKIIENVGTTLAYINLNTGENVDDGAIHGIIEVYQSPLVKADFGHGTIRSSEVSSQKELAAIMNALGLDESLLVEDESTLDQSGQFTESELKIFADTMLFFAFSDEKVMQLEA